MPRSTFTDAYAAFTATLVEERTRRGVTQTELAGQLGKPQSFVSKYERGERRLDVVEFSAVAYALGWEPGALLAHVLRSMTEPLRI